MLLDSLAAGMLLLGMVLPAPIAPKPSPPAAAGACPPAWWSLRYTVLYRTGSPVYTTSAVTARARAPGLGRMKLVTEPSMRLLPRSPSGMLAPCAAASALLNCPAVVLAAAALTSTDADRLWNQALFAGEAAAVPALRAATLSSPAAVLSAASLPAAVVPLSPAAAPAAAPPGATPGALAAAAAAGRAGAVLLPSSLSCR
mmetsp:Transcript_20763/g.45424  ORF Transcript_20763/g.45424 Transcript_20763/m.45424 type:complete len:200 (-) Transcript_20763:348-947(-)